MRRCSKMGKGNKGGHKQRPPQPSFFTVQTQKYGSGWINYANTEVIRKNALKIFKDLAYMAIDIEKDYAYFQIYDFVQTLLFAANDNAKYNWYSYIGLANNPMINQDTQMQKVSAEHYEHFVVYSRIIAHLNNILTDISMTDGQNVKYLLLQLMSELRWKKNVFNGYFINISNGNERLIRNDRGRRIDDSGNNNKDEDGFFGSSHPRNM